MRTLISNQRYSAYSSDEEKLRVYIRIVRLLLEEEDSVQAETYYNRATSLIHSTGDRETLLTYKLCQARISDYARKFLEAASRYHELSFVGEIDEDERRFMLYVNAFYHYYLARAPHKQHWDASDLLQSHVPSLHQLVQTALGSCLLFIATSVLPNYPLTTFSQKCTLITYYVR